MYLLHVWNHKSSLCNLLQQLAKVVVFQSYRFVSQQELSNQYSIFMKLEGTRKNDASVMIQEVRYNTVVSNDDTGRDSLLSKFYSWMMLWVSQI